MRDEVTLIRPLSFVGRGSGKGAERGGSGKGADGGVTFCLKKLNLL